MSRSTWAALVVAVVLTSTGGPALAGTAEQTTTAEVPGVFTLTISSEGQQARAIRVAECPPGDPHGPPCFASEYDPSPPGRLPIRCAGRLGLATGFAANRVTVSLQRSNRTGTAPVVIASGRARPVGESRTRWRFRLPCRLGRVSAVAVGVGYEPPPDPQNLGLVGGSASFDLGVVRRGLSE